MNSGYIASEIKSRVKMPDLVRFYGFPIKKDRMPCHIHGGRNENLGIKTDYCHCFKCGYTADVIKFVQDYFSISFAEAIAKINDDFALGLPIGQRIDRRRQTDFAKQAFQRKREQENKQAERDELIDAWAEAHGLIARFENQKNKYKPKERSEELNPQFIEAIMGLELAKYMLECAEKELYIYEKSNG